MKPFKGRIDIDIRSSKPDWEPFQPPRAKLGSPNVLYVILDDTGIAALDVFGGLIEMPNLKRISDRGLRYTQWHTTALCSPSRSCMLTGRNCHVNSMASITEGALGFPCASGLVPTECGTLAEMLGEAGYATYCLGKWHLTPETESTVASTRRTWPTGRGFDRFYGFLGGETNNWYPDLVQDNQQVDQPSSPEQGYHLSKDLVDKAIQYIQDGQQVAPDKPWFAYLSFGANHAPHHSPKEWADRYKGKFDMGYEAYRVQTLARMKEMGIVPKDTELSALNPWPAGEVINENDTVRPWASLSADEKRLFARMAEVYAGFSSHMDEQIGRLLDYLEVSGQIDNTIVVVWSDNGASGEGGPNGSVNENKFFNGWPDDLKENLAKIDELGSPKTYNHYPTGWAVAFNTPFKMFKRFSLEGGIADPLIISWPREMGRVGGQLRDQYHHCIDIVPTVLDCCGVEPPPAIKGTTQVPIQGTSMRYTFADPKAPSTRSTQYYAMLGTRAIYHEGWKAVARHGALTSKGHFMEDPWELYEVAKDRSEVRDLAATNHSKLLELVAVWFAEAGRNGVFPLDDRSPVEVLGTPRPSEGPARTEFTYYPGTAEVPEGVAPNIRNKSYTITAQLELDGSMPEGIVMAQGSRFGGHSLFIKNGRVHYVYNFLGMEEQRVTSSNGLPAAGEVELKVEFIKAGEDPKFVANGEVRLSINGKVVAKGRIRTQPGKFSLAGEGLCIGRDSADAVAKDYQPPFAFTGGVIEHVRITLAKATHDIDQELEAKGAMSRD